MVMQVSTPEAVFGLGTGRAAQPVVRKQSVLPPRGDEHAVGVELLRPQVNRTRGFATGQ